jgi:hypothetical protein
VRLALSSGQLNRIGGFEMDEKAGGRKTEPGGCIARAAAVYVKATTPGLSPLPRIVGAILGIVDDSASVTRKRSTCGFSPGISYLALRN